MQPNGKAIIEVKGLSAGYQGSITFDNISFQVKEGEIFIILGGSGCGKSTLLKQLIGLYAPYQGQILYDGLDIIKAEGKARLDLIRRFGVMYQSGALFGSMTLLENVMLPLEEFTPLPEDARKSIAALKLMLVGLQGFENHMPSGMLLCANTHFPRTFIYTQTFYSIFQQGKKTFLLGERPAELTDVETIDQKILQKHRAYLERLERFPLEKAAYYQRLKESTGIQSVRGLSEITGEDWSYIARILRTLELPAPIQEFLNTHREPAIVKHFHLRILLELVRLGDELAQFARFREMLEKIQD